MQLSHVSEMSYLESRMTIDAVRMEMLAFRQMVEEQKTTIEKQGKKIEELEKNLAQKEDIIRDHWGEEVKDDREDEVMSAIKAAIDPEDHAAAASINLEHGRTIYLPPGIYTLTGARDTPGAEG